MSWPLESVSFRSLVPFISDTGYLTHSLFYYPAKFIPQVPRFCIENYTQEGDWLIDPFAGSATTGLEAILTKRNAVLLDINPILNHIVPLKILFNSPIDENQINKLINDMFSYKACSFVPLWRNISYWYRPEIFEVLSRYWCWVKQLEDDDYKLIIESVLLRASRHFSNANHKTPKLFQSKHKKQFIKNLLSSDWLFIIQNYISNAIKDTYSRVSQLIRVRPTPLSNVIYRGGVDSADKNTFNFLGIDTIPVKAIITSPPYLQAQEYIRTSKLDLYWLGYTEEQVKNISKMEIPYRKAEGVISTPTLEEVKNKIENKNLMPILESYFYYTILALENASNLLVSGGFMCIFVGSPKIDGQTLEIWKVLIEYFTNKGYELEMVFEDAIQNRQLFKNRKNKNPEGMQSEHLVIMRKV